MTERIQLAQSPQEPYRAMLAIEKYLHSSSIEPKLLHMLKLRASQMNGCAYCIDMHWKDARAAGESEQRLYGLEAWRESPYYSDRERAALEWIEALTKIAETHADDEIYNRVREQLSEKEITDLTWLAAAINAWNRIAISFRPEVGSYQPRRPHDE